ncbi:MAG: ribose 5-phosphate isomerase B [Spirochaetaceae bacterium]|jgi:ribose 5-phosphate isomerase B|nr:ribose 5-phosphate isomerase B [Spirochaetaceae bacterium]
MKIAIGNDHAAFDMKVEIRDWLAGKGYEVLDVGTYDKASCDYPVYGKKLADKVASGEADVGIGICGTGIGISLACNKVHGIRAAVCSEACSARLAKQHNNANIICLGARIIGIETAKMIVEEWLNADFQGGRHAERVQMIMDLENK